MIPHLLFKIIKLNFIFWFIYIAVAPSIEQDNKRSMAKFASLASLDTASKNVLTLVLAHPDDEVMFFSPTLQQLNLLPQNIELDINIVCYSNGDAEGLGAVRAKELNDSIALLLNGRATNIYLFDHKDGMDEVWDIDLMLEQLQGVVNMTSSTMNNNNNILLTFDKGGVSGHINHIACHDVVQKFYENYMKLGEGTKDNELNRLAVVYLKSYSKWYHIFAKYSAFYQQLCKVLISKVALSIERLFLRGQPVLTGRLVKISYLDYNYSSSDRSANVMFVNSFAQYILSFAAMLNAHKTQMVYFRYGWWVLSRFVFINDLEVVSSSSSPSSLSSR